jgi:hypothetical protein
MSIVYTSSFNTKNITITVPRALQSGAKHAYLTYSGERLIMQSAVAMTTTFGLNCADKFGPPEYSVDLSFRGHDQRVDLKEFMDTLAQLDEFMINEGVKNSKLWFKADLSRDVVKAFYTPTLKYSKDKDGNLLSYPPNIKLKLRRTNDQFDTKFYDVNGTPYKDVPVEDMLVKHSQLTAIMECGGVWFAGSKFGLSWRAKQIAVHKLPEKMGEFAFKGLSSVPVEQKEVEVDDDAVFAAPTTSAVSAVSAASAAPTASVSVVAALMPQAQAQQVQQADEDEDGEDMEPVPPPKPVMKKKVIAAKK